MTERSEQIQILYEIVTSLDTELDLQDMLKKCLSIYIRKLNCLAGAVFKLNQHGQGENYYFKEIISMPRRIHNNSAYKDAIKQIPQESNKQILNEFYKHLPTSLHISENQYCHIMNLPGFGLIIFLKGGEPLKVDLLNLLLSLNKEIANACKSCLNIDALRESEEKYRLLADNSMDVIWQINLKLVFTYVSPSVKNIMGYAVDEWVGTRLSQHASRKEFFNMAKKALYSIKNYKKIKYLTFNAVMLRKDGTEIPVEITGKLLLNKKGLPIGLQGTTRDITERKQAEDKIKHLNLILRAIRNVNELIVKVKNRERLLKGACENLVKTRGYHNTWIALLDEEGKLETYAEAGLGKVFLPMIELFKKGKLTTCSQKALKQQEVVITENPLSTCTECPLAQKYSGRGAMTIRLEYNGKVYGLISVSIPTHITVTQEEQSLFKEVAGDIAFALRNIELDEERKQTEEKLQETYQRLKKTMDASIETMSRILEAKDPYTAGHQQRVSQLATAAAKELNLSPDKIEGIKIASLIHDIGKIGLPTEILSKPTKLTDIEFSLIKRHSQIGYDILKSIEFPWPIAQIILQHHEKINGSGYPGRLKGDEILLEAKIICVADVVEAMSSHRPYRPALGIDAALEEIIQNRGILYDSEVVDVCLKLFKEKEFKFEL